MLKSRDAWVLANQVDRLGAHLGSVVETLVMTGARIWQEMSLDLAGSAGVDA